MMCNPQPDAIYICPGDPYSAPRGGQTAFAIQALNAFGSRFALVAPDERNEKPVGRWFLDEWKGVRIWRFNVGSYAPKNKSRRPFIPRRIVFRGLIRKYLPAIRQISTSNLFCDSPEVLGLLKKYEWDSFCYRFAGLNNPVGVSRYVFLRFLAGWFHQNMMKNLLQLKPETLLASADRETIAAFEEENRKLLGSASVVFFPTRFDKDLFYPGSTQFHREALGLTSSRPILVSVGRLCWVKGWKLAIDALSILKRIYPEIMLVFVGDGEDRSALETYANERGLSRNVRIEGFLPASEVYKRLVASDLYICASYREGWSVAMTEALGCGKVCVSTSVSGSRDMIRDGVNGRIVWRRDPGEYAKCVCDAFELSKNPEAVQTSIELARLYSTTTLAEDWGKYWKPLAVRTES